MTVATSEFPEPWKWVFTLVIVGVGVPKSRLGRDKRAPKGTRKAVDGA